MLNNGWAADLGASCSPKQNARPCALFKALDLDRGIQYNGPQGSALQLVTHVQNGGH
jgi:hypothetical protein